MACVGCSTWVTGRVIRGLPQPILAGKSQYDIRCSCDFKRQAQTNKTSILQQPLLVSIIYLLC